MAHNAIKMTVPQVEAALTANQGRLALLFTSTDCPNCPAAAAALERAEKRGAVAKALRVDAEQSPDLADYAGVMATPTLQVFDGAMLRAVVTGNRVARALDQL